MLWALYEWLLPMISQNPSKLTGKTTAIDVTGVVKGLYILTVSSADGVGVSGRLSAMPGRVKGIYVLAIDSSCLIHLRVTKSGMIPMIPNEQSIST